jgi:hypothetical protein
VASPIAAEASATPTFLSSNGAHHQPNATIHHQLLPTTTTTTIPSIIATAAVHQFINNPNHTLNKIKSTKLGCVNMLSSSTTTEMVLGIADAQDRLSPYLYPCIIEYSLMCMTVVYVLWSSIEMRYSCNNHSGVWGIFIDIFYVQFLNFSNNFFVHDTFSLVLAPGQTRADLFWSKINRFCLDLRLFWILQF